MMIHTYKELSSTNNIPKVLTEMIRISWLIAIVFISGCSVHSKYYGTYDPTSSVRACDIRKASCTMRHQNAKVDYRFRKLENGKYELDGEFVLFGDKIRETYSNTFSKIRDLSLLFVFFKDHYIVHEEKFHLGSNEFDKPIKFSTVVDPKGVELESSLLINFGGLITEVPW